MPSPSTTTQVLQDIVDTLRASDEFALVTLGGGGTSTEVPRASVMHVGLDSFPCDDSSSGRWGRLRVAVVIRTRSNDRTEGIARAANLCASAAQELVSDPYRDSNCQDLPMGRAMEIEQCKINQQLKHPEVEMALHLRCHFEIQGGE